jgi:lysozyme
VTVLGVDLSHHNALPDFARIKAAGVGFVIAKITEGTSFVDPSFPAIRAGCHAQGLIFGGYHFGRLGDPHAEARFFLNTMKPQPGELVAGDCETSAPGVNLPAWWAAWGQDVKAAVGYPPGHYMNQSYASAWDWSPVRALDAWLWLARYDGVPTGTPVGGWQALAMKQYTDRGTVAGQPGTVDVDAFQGDLSALLRYTIPGGTDMPLTQQDAQLVAAAILNTQLARQGWNADGSPQTGTTSLGAVVQWFDSGLAGVLKAVAAGQPVDAQALATAVVQAIQALPAPAAEQTAALVLEGLNGASLNVTPAKAVRQEKS